jgi:transcriptional regulator with XRE-family HTH domain
MKLRGMSQSDLSKALGVTPGLVSYWLSGKRRPGLDQLKPLSQLTGIPIEDLL